MKISCIPRDVTGTGTSRRLRREDFVPGVIYGKDLNPENISISKKDLDTIIKQYGEHAIVDVNLNGKSFHTIIQEIQRDYLKDIILHVDLHKISKTQKVHVSVPIHLVNTDVLHNEGALVHQMDELEIECIGELIPKHVNLDVSGLKVGHGLTVSDIIVEDGIIVLSDKDDVVVTLSAFKVEEEEPEETEPEMQEPILIVKDKEIE